MSPGSIIVLAAAAPGGVLEVVIWLVAGAIWLASQMAAARKRKARQQARQAAPSAGTERPGRFAGADSPAPDERAEIFTRVGADIPGTRRPAPRPPPAQAARAARPRPAPPPRPAAPRRPHMHRPEEKRVQPEIARRLARARREAEAAARQVQEARKIPDLQELHGLAVRRDDSQSVHAATRSSGLVLPRLHAMDLRLTPFPSVPMPALSRTQHQAPPLRIPLHGRRELRNAIVAQTLLHPPRSEARI
jgi:type IV secretory pathway VirB10-like protein